MTREEAAVVVEDHLRWLEGPGDRATVAHALKTTFFEMGKASQIATTVKPKHVVVVGGGGAIAQEVIGYYLTKGDRVTAVCRKTMPDHPEWVLAGEIKMQVATRLIEVVGTIDLLVAMPGGSFSGKLGNTGMWEWENSLAANLTPVFNAFNFLLPKVADGGNVVVVGSVMGRTGGYGCAAYAAAKAGLVGLVRAAANENATRGVCINLLELGYVDAGMGARLDPKVREWALASIPLRRFAKVEEVVDAIDWLGRVRYMTGYAVPFAGGL